MLLDKAEASVSCKSSSGELGLSEIEFLPLQGCKAAVWKFFGFEAREGEFLEADKCKLR